MVEFANTLAGGAGDDFLIGTDENDLFYGNDGNDTLAGGAGDDLLYGWNGDDVIRGNAGDDTLAGDAGNDSLDGGDGNDQFFAGDGNDTLIGGLGYDVFNAGAGADIIRFESKADSSTATRDLIVNYEHGLDKIDVSSLGYHDIATSNAAQNVLTASYEASVNQTYITDTNSDFGFAIDGNYLSSLGQSDFIFDAASPPPTSNVADVIYAPILGQSNATGMIYFLGDDESGATVLESELSSATGIPTVGLFYSSPGNPINLAIGASSVDGNISNAVADKVWWYPDSSEAGNALTRAVGLMKDQLASLQAQGVVKTVLTWWQGEESGWEVGFNADPQNAANRYAQATSDIFDYIKAELNTVGDGADIDFYIIQTPFIDRDAATNGGLSEANQNTLDAGLSLVRAKQEELANGREDVHFAVTIDDLPTAEDTGNPDSATDKWHLAPDAYEIVGSRLASYIANDLEIGTDNTPQLITGTESADTLSGAAGDDTIFGGNHDDVINGGAGDDRLNGQRHDDTVHGGEGNDVVIGYTGDDVVYGDAGNDKVYGASGNDTLYGGDGKDYLSGYKGNDILDGGAGRDVLFGGADADIFTFASLNGSTKSASDRIKDFEVGVDNIDLSGLGFTGLDTDGGGTEAGELRLAYSNASDRTYVRTDQGDFEFFLNGDYQLTLTDNSFTF